MENKPGEMKCFAWKIDFSLPGNKLSVPHWPFDLLYLFEFAEVSHFILDTFRRSSTHYSEIFLSSRITSAVVICKVKFAPQPQQPLAWWRIRFQNDKHLSIPHHVSATWFHRPLHAAASRALQGTFLFFQSHLLRQQLAAATGPSAFFSGGFDGRLNLVAVRWLCNGKSTWVLLLMSIYVILSLCCVTELKSVLLL